MIKVFTGFKGFAVFFFLIAGIVLVFSIFSWGMSKAAQLLLPVLIIVSYLLIVVFFLGILPATFIKNLRPRLALYSVLMSQVLGVSTWMMAFFFVVKTFGMVGIFLAFLFQLLAPLAIIGAILKSSWAIAGHLILWMSVSYGMKFYSRWLINLNPRDRQKGDIIDVDAIEVSSINKG